MRNNYFARSAQVLLFVLSLLFGTLAYAQPLPPPPVACSISGPSSAGLGSTQTFTLNGSCSASSWSVTCGTVQSSTGTSVVVQFNVYGCSSSTITANGTTATPKNVTVTWLTLTGGTISAPTHQFIYSGTAPAQINASLPTGGDCGTYTYQWDSSTNGSTYFAVSGGTGQNYQPNVLTTTTYFKREAFCTGSSVYTTNIDTVTTEAALVSGTISPSTITVNFDKAPTSGFTVSGTIGGNGAYTYAWQSAAASGGPYTRIAGATSATYTPSGAQTADSWYEVVQYSLGDSVTSSPVELIVNPEVFPGTISPSYLVISSGTSPGTISGNPASGGNCGGSYAYQWQSSPNGTSWTNISGADSLDDTPGTLTSTTWYRRQVICGTDTEYSNTAEIVIGTPNTSYNFIRLRSIQKAGVTDTVTADGLTSPYDVAQTTQYFDGLGRLVQTVAKQASPLQNDFVKPVVYDNFGRQATDYLPYTATTNDGNFKPTALQDQETFNSAQFPGEEVYFGQISYETSPLNRPLVTYAPGASWIGSGNGQSTQYLVNAAADSVQLWSISSVQLSLPVDNGAYAAGQLLKHVYLDEKGNQTVSYTNKFGKIVMAKQQVSASPSTGHYGWLCTYYVFDTLQNLRVIIQPQAVALMNGSWTVNSTIANELCFRYEYDGRRNQAIKKVPGAGQLWFVYDARDRVAMSQDSVMRSNEKWLFIKYDSENRPDSTGTITDPSHYTSLAYHDSLAYYSTSYPTVSSFTNELLAMTFYDDYSWVSTYSAPVGSLMATTYTGNSSYFITTYNTSPTYAVAITPFIVTRGMKTGAMQKVIGTTSTYLYNSTFYDDRSRVIQSQNVNYTGAIDTATSQYNFSDMALRRMTNHKKNNNTVQNHIVLTKMDYDQSMRLRHIYKNIDNAASDQLIDSLQYNELGELVAKYLGNRVDSVIYTYNIRGWLTGINKNYVAGTASHYFGMEIGYNKTSSVAPGNTYLNPQLNGNIEGIVWKGAGSGINRKYDFSYDPTNRLTAAAFLQNTTGTSWDKTQIDFSVSGISYDANGNLQTMTQRGFTVGGSAPIDSLTYNYINPDSSNRLIEVTNAANDSVSLLEDFHYKASTKQSTDYAYDGNGNLIKDNNKAIDNITYNYLSLQQLVHIKGEGNVTYTYDAAGNKLAKVIADSVAGVATTITYMDGFVYQQRAPLASPGSGTDTLQFIGHEEGRTRWAYHKYTNGTTAYKFEYDFFERDHLGNTRTVLTQERDTSNYMATMEYQYRGTELQLFNNIVQTDTAWTAMPNYTNIPNNIRFMYTSPNDSVSRVDSTSSGGQKVGPNLLLKVMSGDTVNLSVQCYYVSPGGGSTNNSSFSDVLNSLSNGLVNLTGGAHGTLSNLTSSGSTVYNGLSSFLSADDTAHSGYPKAYLNWIFLDDQFNYVSGLSGSVLAASSTYPAGSMNLVAPGGPIAMNKSGYIYIWVSNETTGWDVYYDNLSIQYKQGPLLEENHYYPFGLTMAGISDKAIKTNYAENKYRYDAGTELQNKEFNDGTGLETYETQFRMLDPQLGRFTQIDPMSDMNHFESTYQYADNNPISGNDPTGLFKPYTPPPTYLKPSYYSNSNNWGLPTIQWINQQIGFSDGMPGGADASNSGGGGGGGGGGPIYKGNDVYQLPNGDYVDFWTALNYVMDHYSGTSTSIGGNGAFLFAGLLQNKIFASGMDDYGEPDFEESSILLTSADMTITFSNMPPGADAISAARTEIGTGHLPPNPLIPHAPIGYYVPTEGLPYKIVNGRIIYLPRPQIPTGYESGDNYP
jgi:RHS repeat-associated protein